MKLRTAPVLMALTIASSSLAQTTSTRDTVTAYGARLTAKGLPADLNQRRTNSRIINRIDNRLSLRIERYRPDNTNNPTAAFETMQSDKSRTAPVPVPPPREDD